MANLGTAVITANFLGGHTTASQAAVLIRNAMRADGWTVNNVSCSLLFNNTVIRAIINVTMQSTIDPATIRELFRDTMARTANIGGGVIGDISVTVSPRTVLSATLGTSGAVTPSGSLLGLSGSAGTGNTYTVRSGDTFNAIAARFGMTAAALQALNPQVTNINVISVGQVLRVSGAPASTPVVTAVNPQTGVVTVNPLAPSGQPQKNWFDRTFFDGAGALTGVGVGVLVVLGVVVISQRR